jgi:hypothetical protein
VSDQEAGTPATSERIEPPFVNDERAMLESWLEFHRTTLLMKCEGLDDAGLRQRSVPPSSLSLLGLVRHLTDVERNWFRRILIDEGVPWLANPDGDFDDVDGADVAADIEAFRAELDTCRSIAAQHPNLDAIGAGKRYGVYDVSLRWIYVHMIEEYARHNGHADLLRERIDGVVGW